MTTITFYKADGYYYGFEEIKKLYSYIGSEEKCVLAVGDGGHLNYADLLWENIHGFGY